MEKHNLYQPAIPAASVWPIFVFYGAKYPAGLVFVSLATYTDSSACNSTGSPSEVPVPCLDVRKRRWAIRPASDPAPFDNGFLRQAIESGEAVARTNHD